MSFRLIALLLSVAANLALGAWWLLHPSVSLPSRPSAASPAPASRPIAEAGPLDSPVTRKTWAALRAGTDADYASRLRTEGFPPDIIRALLKERIRARYQSRLDALKPKSPDPYWQHAAYNGANARLSPEARAARRAIEREIGDAVRQAMGADFDSPDPMERAQRLRTYGNLPREKVEQLMAIDSDYRDLSAQVRDSADGFLLPEDREQLRLLEREKRNDLAATLTPDELLEYDLRASPSASTVRSRLAYFNPTEAEFRTLAQLQLDFDREYGSGNLDADERAARANAEKALQLRMQSVLTPERAAEYQLVTTPAFQSTARLLQQFNYDAGTARTVTTLQFDITARAEAIRQNPLYTPEIRAAELDGLYREATAKLGATLGRQPLDAYQSRGPGQWLKKLQPAPAKPDAPGKT